MNSRIACLALAAAVSLGTALAQEAQVKKELAPLQGTWKVVELEVNGKNPEFVQKAQWVIKGNKVLYAGEELAELTIDNTTKPPCIDLSFRKPKKVLEGIYSVEKDTLKICVNSKGEGAKERPTDFKTDGKENWRLLVFERIKGKKADAAESLAGFIGIQIMALKDPDRVAIGGVIKDSPAMQAGVKKDDILLKVGGQEVTDLQTVISLIREMKPGSNVTVRVKRGDKEQDITVKVGVMPFFLLD
jgi:uncharacterized protein (TIGR03067 family)